MNTKATPAVIILSQNSINVARQITSILPGAKLYGLASRTQDVDESFTNFGDTLRDLFAQNIPIIGICAAGILIRTVAPLISDKRQEPPLIAVAEDGSAVVPLLGGLSGVNELARQIGTTLQTTAAITTTGDIRFHTALLSPPPGYHLANPEDGKKFIADLIAGAKVKIEGIADWLIESNLPIDEEGELTIQVTEKEIDIQSNCLVYHPANVAIAITSPNSETLTQINELLATNQISPQSIAVIIAPIYLVKNPILEHISSILQVPTRFVSTEQITEFTKQGYSFHAAVIFAAQNPEAQLLSSPFAPISISIYPTIINPATIGQNPGKLAIIGTGPGAEKWMSPEVKEILNHATDLVGYKTYINLIGNLADGKKIHASDNREEEDRAKIALDLAAQGKYVVVVSSGDPGIYAMATAIFEVIDKYNFPEWQKIDIQVAPGISAMQATAAAIGAPLGHDFCVISLSDILKPWEMIAQRIEKAAQGDFVMAFYNPVSKYRAWQLTEARNILLKYRKPDTPVILGWNLGRPGQTVKVINLEDLDPVEADMRTLIIVGSSQTRKIQTSEQNIRVYTPRRYPVNS